MPKDYYENYVENRLYDFCSGNFGHRRNARESGPAGRFLERPGTYAPWSLV